MREAASVKPAPRNILTIDVGGRNVKLLATGHHEPVKIRSGKTMTPSRLVTAVQRATKKWKFDAVSIGYPGPVRGGRPVTDPPHLGPGWKRFDFEKAFGCPVRIVNDAAMQALGSYDGGTMLFLGLGTGLGSVMIVDGIVEPLELGHLPFRKRTFEDYVSRHALEKHGKTKWQTAVFETVEHLSAAIQPDYVVLGGGEAEELDQLPDNCRLGSNANAFVGGFRLWEPEWIHRTHGGVGDVAG